MKAISLWQPWASAIALGSKRIETRSWSTGYRGPIAIHAASRCVHRDMAELYKHDHWKAALSTALWPFNDVLAQPWRKLPFGKIVATAHLEDVKPVEDIEPFVLREALTSFHHRAYWTEWMMGDYSPGRFGWILTNVKPLGTPIPFRGRQQLFDVTDELLEGAA